MTFPQLSLSQVAVPGILGGMGPLAHVVFEQRLIEKNAMSMAQQSESADQFHPIWVLISATNIPDRTKDILKKSSDCQSYLLYYGQFLEQCGVDFIVVTCNSSHAFYNELLPRFNIPWIHLIDETVNYIRAFYPHILRVGVMATDGTLSMGLYKQSLEQAGLIAIEPQIGSAIQNQVMDAIYHPQWGIKRTGIQVSEQANRSLYQARDWLQNQGAELIIAGCTEISVVQKAQLSLDIPWIDPLDVVAEITLDLAFGRRALDSWKTGVKIRKKNNQKFVQIPHAMMMNLT